METGRPVKHSIALQRLGFRPFFLAAAAFAVVSVALWLALYHFSMPPLIAPALPAAIWHAHEMVYGYALAVAGGFLLTAARNWTGVQTVRGTPLMLLVLLWFLARIAPFLHHPPALVIMAVLDLAFDLLLCVAVLHPIARSRQWRQVGLWSKLAVLGLANGLFYLGVFGILEDGVRLGLYTGLYLVLSLMLLVGRRVIPFFIERGVDYPVTLTNRRWLDIAAMVLMLIFIVAEVFIEAAVPAAASAALLCVLHAIRMAGWYTPGVWRIPLLWVLYLAYGWIVLGFALIAVARIAGLSPALAIHAFAYGGIGLMTLGMMARVSLGHTGRSLSNPPAVLPWAFAALAAGGVARVIAPMIIGAAYPLWIACSQLLCVGRQLRLVSRICG